jgi:hypothetical protein
MTKSAGWRTHNAQFLEEKHLGGNLKTDSHNSNKQRKRKSKGS